MATSVARAAGSISQNKQQQHSNSKALQTLVKPPSGAGTLAKNNHTSSSSQQYVIFEAHITDLIRRDGRWRALWSRFLEACTIPDDALTTYPGLPLYENKKRGMEHLQNWLQCREEKPEFFMGWAQGILSPSLTSSQSRQTAPSCPSSSSTATRKSSRMYRSYHPSTNGNSSEEDVDVKDRRQKGCSTSSNASSEASFMSSYSVSSVDNNNNNSGHKNQGWKFYKGRYIYLPSEKVSTQVADSGGSGGSEEVQCKRKKHDLLIDDNVETEIKEMLKLILGGQVRKRGLSYYPPHGYKSWHKNAFDPRGSYRLTILHNLPSGRSQFRYRHPNSGVVQTSADNDGTLRLYKVTSSLWHSMTTEEDGHCWTLTYQLSADAAQKLLGTFRGVRPCPLVTERPPPLQIEEESGGTMRRKPSTPLAVRWLFGSSSSSSTVKRATTTSSTTEICLQQYEVGGKDVQEQEEEDEEEGEERGPRPLSLSSQRSVRSFRDLGTRNEEMEEVSICSSSAWVVSGELEGGSSDEGEEYSIEDVDLHEVTLR